VWLSTFNDVGQQLLGYSADDLERLRSEDEQAFGKVIAGAVGKMYNFRCRAKSDSFNDQVKVRYHGLGASEVDFAAAASEMIKQIQLY
jgi:replication factor A1